MRWALRRGKWAQLLASVTALEHTTQGVQVSFPLEAGLAEQLTRLASAEQSCCAFLGFTVAFTPTALLMSVAAPPLAHPVLIELFGAP